MTRNEPSALQIVLEELRLLRSDMKIENIAIRHDIRASMERADAAHDEIAKYRNRLYGWLTAIGGGGVTIGVSSADGIKSLVKAFLS